MLRTILILAITSFVGVAVFVSLPTTEDKDKRTLSAAAHNDSTANAGLRSNEQSPRDPRKVGHPTFASPHANPITFLKGRVYVANTPADTVDVIEVSSRKLVQRISVGIDPVCVVARPDGKEVWVSNHVSDSVSVIDTDNESPTYLRVIATIQEFDSRTKATRFDEPVGIAFANNYKAYVALSTENQIAVVDVKTRKVTRRIRIPAQDPRDIVVRNDRLYVVPFESNNKTQLSGGAKKDIDGKLVTFDAWQHSIRVNNVLSIGHVTDIVKHPDVPDRDLFVYDTKTDRLVESVDSLGTLLYGLAVDSKGQAFIAQTDARNDVNGRSGTKKHSLKELENRAFLNQVTKVDFDNGKAKKPELLNLEPLPPKQPEAGSALATPYAIEISQDDKTLFVSAAGSNKVFTMDADSGKVLGRIKVGSVPRGIALQNNKKGEPSRAWIYNAVANTVSCIDVTDRAAPKLIDTVTLEDPTHPDVKAGRRWFNDASASTTETFSCASCHPDGHTDQLLWVLKTPVVTGGNQIMPRSTMPIRGLRDTAPFHWDGIPGDPYGGNNSANIHGSSPPNSKVDEPESTTRNLIDGGLASTMHLDGDKTKNDEGKVGKLSGTQRDEMAKFLLSLPYPPAQRRAFDNVVSARAQTGFELFHVAGDNDPSKDRPNVCGNCHRMPFLVSTNTPGTGMDAPTWRGAYDRFLILPQGRLNIIEFPFYRSVAKRGQSEEEIWRFSWGGRQRFNKIWDMVVEGSTGFSGSFARQVTVNKQTHDQDLTLALVEALETSAAEEAIILEVDGIVIREGRREAYKLQFDSKYKDGVYVNTVHDRKSFSRKQLLELAAQGQFIGTFTGRHGEKADLENPQPAIWTLGSLHRQSGRQKFPILHSDKKTMSVSGRHFDETANVFIDGRKSRGRIRVAKDRRERVEIELDSLPQNGMHLLQIQTQNGMFSNDFIFYVSEDAESAKKLQRDLNLPHIGPRDALARAIVSEDLEKIKSRLKRNKRLDVQRVDGSTLLHTAVLYGRHKTAKYLIELGADVNAANRDGNTPLHTAAFLYHTDMVKFLLGKGASATKENNRGDTPIEVVSGRMDRGLTRFYSGLASGIGIEIDLDDIKKQRPVIAKMLREHGK